MTTPMPSGSHTTGTADQPDGYGAGPYAGGGYVAGEATREPAPRNGFGIAGLILGTLSLLLFWAAGLPGVLLGIPGLILAILGTRRAKRGEASMGLGVSGVVVSSIGLLLSIAITVFAAWVVTAAWDCLNPVKYPTAQTSEQCMEERIFG